MIPDRRFSSSSLAAVTNDTSKRVAYNGHEILNLRGGENQNIYYDLLKGLSYVQLKREYILKKGE